MKPKDYDVLKCEVHGMCLHWADKEPVDGVYAVKKCHRCHPAKTIREQLDLADIQAAYTNQILEKLPALDLASLLEVEKRISGLLKYQAEKLEHKQTLRRVV